MLTMYLDESLEANDGYAVVAGFVGNDESWNECMAQWRGVLADHGRSSVHLNTLRGWEKDRHELMLAELGVIPATCGLTLLYCSVRVSDYRDMIRGTMSDLFISGYLLTMNMVISLAMLHLPKEERVEVICENQIAYGPFRESFLKLANRMPDWKTSDGLSRIAKWSSIPKSTVLEPSDYAAYAVMQNVLDTKSRKAQLCAPILINPSRIGHCISRAEARLGVRACLGAVPRIDMKPEVAKLIRSAFRQEYGGEK